MFSITRMGPQLMGAFCIMMNSSKSPPLSVATNIHTGVHDASHDERCRGFVLMPWLSEGLALE